MTMMTPLVLETDLAGLRPPKRGKVRDIYDLGEALLIVATDRISAFDVVLPNAVPEKIAHPDIRILLPGQASFPIT
jgi:phosphoribosylaminoimidazole-succinocarboxamide synthase